MEIKYHCKYDELVEPKKLVPHSHNRNKHPSDQLKRLAKILEYQGWRYAVKVSKQTGMVTTGHGRMEAAKILKCAVPVVYQEYDDTEQEYADVQSDNAIASWAELDLSGVNEDLADLGPFDIDLLGIENFTVEAADKYNDEKEDSVPDVPEEPKTQLGDLYLLGDHRLYCGDSTDKECVDYLMNGEKADMVFTDPPYGISYEENTIVGS